MNPIEFEFREYEKRQDDYLLLIKDSLNPKRTSEYGSKELERALRDHAFDFLTSNEFTVTEAQTHFARKIYTEFRNATVIETDSGSFSFEPVYLAREVLKVVADGSSDKSERPTFSSRFPDQVGEQACLEGLDIRLLF